MKAFYHLGKYVLMIKSLFARPENFGMYTKELFRQMQQIGVGSLSIITIMSFFIGAVTAVQFAYQLEDMPMPMWYIGIIVRDSMILELAPTLTALLIAGKVGSNISSELGNMRISEQIDALKIMGVNTTAYLIGPKVMAGVIVFPLLLIFGVTAGIYGGLMAGITSGIYSTTEYIRGLQDPMEDYNTFIMFVKGIVFAFIITSVSCYQGFNATGGSVGVGNASTRAVVMSSIIVIVANFLIASLLL